MRSTARLAHALRGRKKAVVLVGTAAALMGAGTASAATVVSAHPAGHVPAAHTSQAQAPVHPATQAAMRPATTGSATRQESWSQIEQTVASQTSPSEPKAADQLKPVSTAGTQAWMPIGAAQRTNATTIVQQALTKRMGLRSAVIAVATSMQESQLQNINYGTSDSLGLFQQQPDCGWGTAQQVMNPAYAADAFLTALQHYQAGNPGWADQPLWQSAQGVQASAFPFAYAKWEAQAAHLVRQIVTELR